MDITGIRNLVSQLGNLPTGFFQKDFLLTWNHTDAEIRAVALAAEILEEMYRANVSTRVFQAGLAVSNFRDKSTRTRFSFASAASLLGLSGMDFDESKSQIAHGETVRETANMISFTTEAIGIRDDLFVGYGARVRIVYVEVAAGEARRRNRSRRDPVPERVLDEMMASFTVPDWTEAETVEWQVDGVARAAM